MKKAPALVLVLLLALPFTACGAFPVSHTSEGILPKPSPYSSAASDALPAGGRPAPAPNLLSQPFYYSTVVDTLIECEYMDGYPGAAR